MVRIRSKLIHLILFHSSDQKFGKGKKMLAYLAGDNVTIVCALHRLRNTDIRK
jgi:hypothetical protein